MIAASVLGGALAHHAGVDAVGQIACVRIGMRASSRSPWSDSVKASTACLVAP